MISFQVGHVCRSVGETLLTLHEVMTYGSINGQSALPQRRQDTKAISPDGTPGTTGQGNVQGSNGENRSYPIKAQGEGSGHTGGTQEDAPKIITELEDIESLADQADSRVAEIAS